RGLRAVAGGGVGAVGLPAALAWTVEAAALQALGQVALLHPAAGITMGVLVLPVVLRAGTVAVAQMVGHLARGAVAHLGQRRVDAGLRRVALGGERQVDSRLRQVDAALGIA